MDRYITIDILIVRRFTVQSLLSSSVIKRSIINSLDKITTNFPKLLESIIGGEMDGSTEIFRDGGFLSKILFPVEQNRCSQVLIATLNCQESKAKSSMSKTCWK